MDATAGTRNCSLPPLALHSNADFELLRRASAVTAIISGSKPHSKGRRQWSRAFVSLCYVISFPRIIPLVIQIHVNRDNVRKRISYVRIAFRKTLF
ncbi:hypothetical protein PUN28_010750 [Cardiocondyla obscurior]|uniref:Uncharacterized protein n=1 Tax=Cardiocondyla obscurior TaxID=286306 RepID=A0AAW2FHK0_9HYME